ncbi:MAG: TIGR00725 family protein [candidate division Zixibacteria bacterium]|nr:TIGR00725 family protein [candidate division Zixibacteria bacterium]
MVKRKVCIAVIGHGECSPELQETAASIGRCIAHHDAVLVCGGLGGVMEAAARGAKEAGGTTIGIIPGLRKADANPYIDHVIATGLGDARNLLVVRSADVVIALPGKYGTLSEISFALMAGIPVISVSSWAISDDIIQVADPIKAAQLAIEIASKKL